MRATLIIIAMCVSCTFQAQLTSSAWNADTGNGNYRNPIIHADYSDPDAIRVGDDYFMVSSSFNSVPGLPILHSRDLVNWKLIGHALHELVPVDHFKKVQHGGGVWAPSIRYHKGEFYIYYPDPDFGIYLVKSKDILGPWSSPVLVTQGKGLIDPCPLWDENGKTYLVHAFAGSRAGIKSVIVIREMNAEGTTTTGAPVIVYDGHEKDPTVEGPKFYKRNGFYYIFAPAGGVSTGWQTVLRSKNVYGPYERKVVMHQGSTAINGPHQGAWIDTKSGEHWFLHFQDKDAYGRIVHLQPMKWVNDWPVIGTDDDGDGTGEPVMAFKKPSLSSKTKFSIDETDEFNSKDISLQWQWQANPEDTWAMSHKGALRLYTQLDSTRGELWNIPSLLLRKFPATEFMATAKLTFNSRIASERIGLVVFGTDYAFIGLESNDDKGISFITGAKRDASTPSATVLAKAGNGRDLYLRVSVRKNGECFFSYSNDGNEFIQVKDNFIAKPGKWVGARIGFFATRSEKTNDAGYMDIDWFRVERIENAHKTANK